MGDRLKVEYGPETPQSFHYVVSRPMVNSEANFREAEQVLLRNGCTYIFHHVPIRETEIKRSFGIVERIEVVNQRINQVSR